MRASVLPATFPEVGGQCGVDSQTRVRRSTSENGADGRALFLLAIISRASRDCGRARADDEEADTVSARCECAPVFANRMALIYPPAGACIHVLRAILYGAKMRSSRISRPEETTRTNGKMINWRTACTAARSDYRGFRATRKDRRGIGYVEHFIGRDSRWTANREYRNVLAKRPSSVLALNFLTRVNVNEDPIFQLVRRRFASRTCYVLDIE